MVATDAIALLLRGTLASSAAVVLVLLLRRPLRGAFGAGVAYAAWMLVPAMLLALALPGPRHASALALSLATVGMPRAALVAAPAPESPWPALVIGTWGAGVACMLAWLAFRQSRFQRSIGDLRRGTDGTWHSAATAGLPAVVGLLPSRIVLPRDFDLRYDARQRSLVLAHERVHLARGDVRWNALATLLRGLFWFNPLLHLAHARFRHDQELACDQRVVARHPDARHAYGDAMLKTQLATQALPLGCHWGHRHSLKERLEMLKHPLPTSTRLRSGTALVALLVCGGAYAAWASQPATSVAPTVAAAARPEPRIAPQRVAKAATTTTSTSAARAGVQPARQKLASRTNEWSSYEQLVGSLSASWQPPKPAEDGC